MGALLESEMRWVIIGGLGELSDVGAWLWAGKAVSSEVEDWPLS